MKHDNFKSRKGKLWFKNLLKITDIHSVVNYTHILYRLFEKFVFKIHVNKK